jgi:uncharacterized protein YodC (DUF2158 family)
MRRHVMMVLATAALAGSLLATDAQARGGGAHMGRFGGAHIIAHGGGFGGARMGGIGGSRTSGFGGGRVGGIGGGYVAGIPRGAVGYAAGTGYGMGTGYRTGIHYGTGIRYGTGILGGGSLVLAASEAAQTAPDSSTGASAPAPAQGAAQNPRNGTGSGSGFTIVGRDGVSPKTVGMAPASSASVPSNTQNQDSPAFRSGNLVRLRSGGPLMTVRDIKGDQVDCFWTDVNGQINADSFPVHVLQME